MDILENFSLSKPYKFCIYLSSVVLVSSFIAQPLDIDVNDLRKACFSLITWGVVFWILENIYYNYLQTLKSKDYRRYDYEQFRSYYTIINASLNGIYLFIALLVIGKYF